MSNAVVNCFLIPFFFFFFFFFGWAFNLLIIENRYHDVILNPNWLPNRYNIPLWKTWMFKVCFLNSEHLGQCTRKLQHVWKNCHVYGIVNRLIFFFLFLFVIFGCDLYCSRSVILFKSQTSRSRKLYNNFCCIVFLFASFQKVCFKILEILFPNWRY